MANAARGEAEIEIAGKSYAVAMNMGALARMAAALGVKKFPELHSRLTEFNLEDMPLVVEAILQANGHDVARATIETMDPFAYVEVVIPAIFRRADDPRDKPEGKEAEEGNGANPPKARAKK